MLQKEDELQRYKEEASLLVWGWRLAVFVEGGVVGGGWVGDEVDRGGIGWCGKLWGVK